MRPRIWGALTRPARVAFGCVREMMGYASRSVVRVGDRTPRAPSGSRGGDLHRAAAVGLLAAPRSSRSQSRCSVVVRHGPQGTGRRPARPRLVARLRLARAYAADGGGAEIGRA